MNGELIWPASCHKLQFEYDIKYDGAILRIDIRAKNAPNGPIGVELVLNNRQDLDGEERARILTEALLKLAYQNMYPNWNRSLYMYDAYAVEDFMDDVEDILK